MRVKGNLQPEAVSVSPYEPRTGYVEVKVRENIAAYTETVGEEETSGYEYDEYTFIVPLVSAEAVRNNLSAWLATGRCSEVAPNASLYMTAKDDAVDEYTAQLIEEGLI